MSSKIVLKTTDESKAILVRILRLLIATLLSLLTYLLSSAGSKGHGSGGFQQDGGFVDSQGNPTTEVPRTISLTLGPSFSFVVLLLLIVVIGIWMASRSQTSKSADQTLRATVAVIVGFTLVAIYATHVSFGLLEFSDDMTNGQRVTIPFGQVSVTVEDDIFVPSEPQN